MKKPVYNYRSTESSTILHINFFSVLIFTEISKNAIKGELYSILVLTLPGVVYHFRDVTVFLLRKQHAYIHLHL